MNMAIHMIAYAAKYASRISSCGFTVRGRMTALLLAAQYRTIHAKPQSSRLAVPRGTPAALRLCTLATAARAIAGSPRQRA